MPAKIKTKTKPAIPKAKSTRPMPKFTPAPEWIKELFGDLISYFPEAEPRKMFGYPCAFVNGNMACGVFADRLMVRLSETDRADFLKVKDAKMFAIMGEGRPMKEYVEVPPQMLKSPTELRKWMKKSVTFAKTLPSKAKKGK